MSPEKDLKPFTGGSGFKRKTSNQANTFTQTQINVKNRLMRIKSFKH
jgi:hypothetical protein